MVRILILISIVALGCVPDSPQQVAEDVPISVPESARIEIIEPEYLILRPVSAEAGEGAVSARLEGRDFYFDPENQILDLRLLDPISAEVEPGSGGGYAIFVLTTAEGAQMLRNWTSSNIGEQLGVFLNGHLISAPFVETPISSMIIIEPGTGKAEAEQIAARIRRGGAEK